MVEGKPGKPLYKRREVLVGALGLGGLAVGAFALTSSTQTSKPEVQKTPSPESVALTVAKTVIQGDFEKTFALLHPETQAQLNSDPTAKETFRDFIIAHGACSSRRLNLFSPALKDPDNLLIFTFVFDEPCTITPRYLFNKRTGLKVSLKQLINGGYAAVSIY